MPIRCLSQSTCPCRCIRIHVQVLVAGRHGEFRAGVQEAPGQAQGSMARLQNFVRAETRSGFDWPGTELGDPLLARDPPEAPKKNASSCWHCAVPSWCSPSSPNHQLFDSSQPRFHHPKHLFLSALYRRWNTPTRWQMSQSPDPRISLVNRIIRHGRSVA